MNKKINILSLLLLIAISIFGQEKRKVNFINFQLNEYDKIELIDHQNMNCDWYYGRVYEIVYQDGRYELFRTKQYDKPYFFRASDSPNKLDTLNFQEMKLIESLGISVDSARHILDHIQGKINQLDIPDKRYIGNSNDRVFIRNISLNEIQSLESAINSKKECFINNTYSILGIDSVWLSLNAERLFKKYNHYKSNNKAKKRCIRCIMDIENAKLSSYWVFSGYSTSDYPYCELKLISKTDTITISTDKQKAYMLPWNMNDKYESFNPNLSIAFGNLLPENNYSNRYRLTGNKARELYEKQLTEEIIYRYCRGKGARLKIR